MKFNNWKQRAMKSYDTESKVELVAAREIFELAQEAKEIFISSKSDEKQQLLGFFFFNLRLNGESLDVEVREPFKILPNVQDQHVWRAHFFFESLYEFHGKLYLT